MKIFRFTFLILLMTSLLIACTTLPATEAPITEHPGDAIEPPATTPSNDQPTSTDRIAEDAIKALASLLGIQQDAITVTAIEAVDWPDGCLGTIYLDRMCTSAIVPGYRIMLEAEGKTYEYRSNGDGSLLLPAEMYMSSAENPVTENARKALAQVLGISSDQVTVSNLVAVDWPNGCLGIHIPGTACTEAIVPGFQIILFANGQTYEYRSNGDGSLILAAEPVFPMPNDHKVAGLARTDLAKRLGIAEDAIAIVSIEGVDWPDGCLGVNLTDTACITVITPGFRIILQANGENYEYHTNATGSQIILATSVPATEEIPALQVDIQGGIAGFCDHVSLFVSGLATFRSCNFAQETRYQMTPSQLQTLQNLVSQFRSFEYTQADPAVADQMVVQFIFNGTGSLEPTAETYQQMQALAMEVIGMARGFSPDS